MIETTQFIKAAMQWPFLTLFSCTWAFDDLTTRYNNQNVPLLFEEKQADGKYRVPSLMENIGLNILFNMGFLISDVEYLIGLSSQASLYSASGELFKWPYRNAFAIGDIYMRLFYRSLASVPLKLKSDTV